MEFSKTLAEYTVLVESGERTPQQMLMHLYFAMLQDIDFFEDPDAVLANCEIYNNLALKFGQEGRILFTKTRVLERARVGPQWRRYGSHHRLQGRAMTLKLLAAETVETAVLRHQSEVMESFCWRLMPPLVQRLHIPAVLRYFLMGRRGFLPPSETTSPGCQKSFILSLD